MRTLERTCSVITADRDGIAQAQTTGGAANLTLNGAGVTSGVATLTPPRRVRIFSGGNIAAVVFTITGTDRAGHVITDTITGVNNSTVATNKIFRTVTQVAAGAAVGTNAEVGWNDESISAWIILGSYSHRNFAWTLHAFATSSGGTISFDVEGTSQNLLRDQVHGDHPDHLITLAAAQTANYLSNNSAPIAAVRLKLNTTTDREHKLRVQPSVTG